MRDSGCSVPANVAANFKKKPAIFFSSFPQLSLDMCRLILARLS